MEGLPLAIEDTIYVGLYYGVSIGIKEFMLSHLCYADDVIILSDWERHNLVNMVYILNYFYLVYINLQKSNLFGIGVTWEEVTGFTKFVRCKPDKMPFTYLGLPDGQNMSRVVS